MTLEVDGKAIEAIAFNVDIKSWPNPNVKNVYCVYRLDINEFRGNRTVQMLVELVLQEKP